jgi:hypothetical protein
MARGREYTAQDTLKAAAGLAVVRRCEGYLLPLARYVPTLLERRHALRRLNAPARALLLKLELAATGRRAGDEEAGCLLELMPFGAGIVRIDGRLVEPADLDAKAREVLFYLAQVEGPVSRAEAKEAIWPEESWARGTLLLSEALYRLRCALGGELLPQFKRQLALKATVHDAGRELLALADEAFAAHEAGDQPRVAAILARASGYLAGGPFLPWCTSAWAVEARERYAVAAGRLAALGGCGNADATDAPLAHRVM